MLLHARLFGRRVEGSLSSEQAILCALAAASRAPHLSSVVTRSSGMGQRMEIATVLRPNLVSGSLIAPLWDKIDTRTGYNGNPHCVINVARRLGADAGTTSRTPRQI